MAERATRLEGIRDRDLRSEGLLVPNEEGTWEHGMATDRRWLLARVDELAGAIRDSAQHVHFVKEDGDDCDLCAALARLDESA